MGHLEIEFYRKYRCWKNVLWTILFICCLCINVTTQAQEKKITTEFKDVALSDALKRLEKLSDYKILFTYDDVQSYKVTVSLKKVTITEALKMVLEGKPFIFSDVANGKYISVVYQPEKKSDKMKEIKGTITDNKGGPIIGATVRVVNTSVGTASDVNGQFTLRVPENVSALEIGFVGMKTQLVSIVGKTELQIIMEEDNMELGDVVVTGIFKKAKESYTGAVSTITAEDLKVHKGQNLLQTLKNADASLNFAVNNLAGSNPNAVPELNIRGNSSLPMSVTEFNETASNAVNTPLIIMDGFEISLEKLMDYNDEEIESINILKDAAATAIYGSRGSNGVIVIITKQPEPGKLRVNAEVGIDMEVPDLMSYDLLNATEKLALEKQVGLYDSTNPETDLLFKSVYNERLLKVLSGATTDWIAKPIRTGVGSHYNLRLEGGSEQFRWSGSISYKNTQGAMKNSARRVFNGSITLMYSVDNLIFKNYTSYGMTRANESNYGSFSDYVAQQPYNSPYDENGNIVERLDNFYGPTRGNGEPNPLYDASLNTINKNGYEELTNNFSIEWNINKDLTLRGQFGITSITNHSDYFLPANHSYFTIENYEEYNTDEGFFRRGRYEYGTGKTYSYSGNLTLSYSKIFKDKHQLYVGLDYSVAADESRSYSFVVEGFSDENMSFLGNAREYEKDGIPSGAKTVTRRLGFTGNVNYTYDGKYYVDASARVDGSSTFGSDKKYAPFWSVGIGWNLHNEAFLSNSLFNIMRLKMSYGSTGSQQGSGSGATTLYAYESSNKYMNWTGSVLQEWGNPQLTWQTTNEFNVGTEIGLWQGRIRLEFDYYTKVTSNLLSYMDLPLSMGIPEYIANVGEVKNRGWETSLNAYIIRDTERELNWIISGQLVYDRNWISKLSDAIKKQTELYLQEEDVEVANLFYEGRPQNAIYAVRSLGIDPSTGKEVFLDRNGNITDTWKAGDKVYLGPADALYRGNLNTMLMWKGLTFNLSFGYYWGGKVYNQTLVDRVEVTTSSLTTSNVDKRVFEDRWQQPGDRTFFKGFSNEETKATSRFVMDDNVLELQSLSLQYRWDSDWIRQNMKLQSITFGVNVNNLFHWSSVKQERGIDYPYARNIQGSIRFLF